MRDIGGIIVIDFIDMARARNRDQVLKTLRTALDEDRTKTYVVEVSPLGLVEMTRQNVTDGVREILTKRCPTCDGEGVVASEETVAISIVRKLQEVVEEDPKPEAYLIRVNPRVAAELLTPDSGLTELEEETGKRFHFEGGDALPLDTFHVVETGTREEIEQRALPFQVGEEVLVSIEEPHMYNVDDAVARVDSYIVSVAGAGPHVGEQRMVRIESVGRSAATAALLDSDGNVVEAGANGDGGEKLESSASGGRRRRGSRGGRRRSRAGGGSKNCEETESHGQLRSDRNRRKAVPRREGLDPARRSPDRRRRATRSTFAPSPSATRRWSWARTSRRSRSRPRSPATSAARRLADLQVPAEEGLPQARRAPLRAHPPRDHRREDAFPESRPLRPARRSRAASQEGGRSDGS